MSDADAYTSYSFDFSDEEPSGTPTNVQLQWNRNETPQAGGRLLESMGVPVTRSSIAGFYVRRGRTLELVERVKAISPQAGSGQEHMLSLNFSFGSQFESASAQVVRMFSSTLHYDVSARRNVPEVVVGGIEVADPTSDRPTYRLRLVTDGSRGAKFKYGVRGKGHPEVSETITVTGDGVSEVKWISFRPSVAEIDLEITSPGGRHTVKGATSGFVPGKHAWRFPNYETPKWKFWAAGWNGVCYGMSAEAIKIFKRREAMPQNTTATDEQKRAIELMQLSQVFQTFISDMIQTKIAAQLRNLPSRLSLDSVPLMAMRFQGSASGHAIVPIASFSLDEAWIDGAIQSVVYVPMYDPNDPAKATVQTFKKLNTYGVSEPWRFEYKGNKGMGVILVQPG